MTIFKDLGTRLEGKTYRRWCLAECVYCGNKVERRTQQAKQAKSCGCATHLKANTSHGMSRTRQYQVWADMKDRCDNKNNSHYYLYGGRGITYTSSWASFEGFWEDMYSGYADDLTLDRIDGSKGYSKDNCQWITRSENTAKASKPGTYRKRAENTYYRLVTKEQLTPYIDSLYTAKRGVKKEIYRECSDTLGISINTAQIYLRRSKNEREINRT